MADRHMTLAAALLAAGLLALAGDGAMPSTAKLQHALSVLAEGNPAVAEDLALEIVEDVQNGGWRGWLVVATARQKIGRYAQAQEAYRQFLAMCQDGSERQFALEQIQRCGQLAKPAPQPEPFSKRLDKDALDRLSRVHPQQSVETTEHFVVRAYNPDVAKLVAGQSEISLARICQKVLVEQDYPHCVDVYVWTDGVQYLQNAGGKAPEWAGGSFSLKHENGQIIRRIDLMQLNDDGLFDPGMLDRVLPHEMCHLVLTEFFGQAHCPLAVNEGLAMMAETVVANSNIIQAGLALSGPKKIPIEELLAVNRCDAVNAAAFYAQSHSLMSYLHQRLTRPQFKDFLEHIKAGCPVEEALQRAMYSPPDEDFLRRLAAAWETEAVKHAQFLQALESAQAGIGS